MLKDSRDSDLRVYFHQGPDQPFMSPLAFSLHPTGDLVLLPHSYPPTSNLHPLTPAFRSEFQDSDNKHVTRHHQTFFFFVFLGLHWQCMEAPHLGVKSEL